MASNSKDNGDYSVSRTIHADRQGLIRFLIEERNTHQSLADGEKRARNHAHWEGTVYGIDLAIGALEDWQEK